MWLLFALLLSPDGGAAPPPALAEIKRIARLAEARPRVAWVREFLHAAQALPSIGRRVFFHDAEKTRYFTAAEADKLPAPERARLVRREVDDEIYYARITDPLGYLRPMEILAQAGFTPRGRRLLDFGYGNIGQLKMLAALGADARGIEVDPLLPKLYAGDVGPDPHGGRVMVYHGYFPTDRALVTAVGDGYDLFISKNTLKRGYVHPQTPQPKKGVIDLGPDADLLALVHGKLKPGGLFFIYNFGPAPAPPGKPYIPMADIACPFSRAALEQAGFEVLAYDVDDIVEGRAVARLLEWDRGPDAMDLERGLGARYTLARRKR
jgi:hypothetical protein